MPTADAHRLRVVVAGAGFAGMEAAKALADAPVDLIVVDRQNHQCFQPLLYQVATATLTPADIAWPIRALLRGQANAQVFMAEAQGVDLGRKVLQTTGGPLGFDVLVLATGATHAYFGRDEWAPFAPGLKRIEDATEIRRRLLLAFEKAELADSEEERSALMTFLVVGGGPTGVEMAGAIRDMARLALPPDFKRVDPAKARVLLVEAGPRILPAFPEALAAYAAEALRRRGVEVMTSCRVTDIDAMGVSLGERRVRAGAVVWAAGVAASAAADWLGAERDRAGRVKVEADLTLPGRPDVFVVGDTALVLREDGSPVPGIAPAAKQMGRYAAEVIRARAEGRDRPGPFVYRHQGDLATIGRNSAIVKIGDARLTGLAGWLFWGAAHIYFLIGLRNRIAVAFSWLWDYLTFGRRARLITARATPQRMADSIEAAPPLAGAPAAADARRSEVRIWS